jgi:hypothetical protein
MNNDDGPTTASGESWKSDTPEHVDSRFFEQSCRS